MLERLSLLLLLVAGTALIWYGLRYRSLLRARRLRLPELERALGRAQSAILYFSTAACTQCHMLQRPALDELQRDLGQRVEVLSFDALDRQDLSSELGILTVPSTVVVDRGGVRAVNLGFASASVLRAQLRI